MAFTHLHLHTEYSLLDGACRLGELCAVAKDLGQTALAITDHGNMFGAVDFYKAAKANGIKPIIGCEVYVAERNLTDKVHGLDSQRYHLVLLCKNETGYKNLIQMVSKSWVDGFYVRPRVDKALLEEYHEGLIALSACLAGEIPRKLSVKDFEGAIETALWYNSVFGAGNYYLELQDHGLREQKEILPDLLRLSRETGIPLVATNDVHYIQKEDAKVQKVLICIQTNHTIDEDTGLEFGTDEFYLKSEAEMRELFSYVPEAIENAKENARRNHIENAEFFCGDAADAAKRFREMGIQPDVVLLDPPRKGCDEAVLKTVAEMCPEKIVYVSCDPATLARDAARLSSFGYMPTRLAAADLFPRTVHVESVCLFLKEK